MKMKMRSPLQISVVLLATVLAGMTWYITLAPFWITQSGERDSSVHYSQGIGIWLNYTEHVGDATYDPGNSLWIPAQESAAHSFADQCAMDAPFCANAVGELHKQYCQVRGVYCGAAIKVLQALLSLLSGVAVLIVVWVVLLVTTQRRTVVDHYLMQLCIANGLTFLAVAAVWYVFVFRVIIESAYYKDQYNRCSENASGRKCWGMGVCIYLIVAAAILYPALSVLVANQVTHKFRTFQRALRRLHESATVVGLAPPPVELKASTLSAVSDINKSTLDVASSAISVDLSSERKEYPTLMPLKKLPSAVPAVNVHEIDVSESEAEEEKRDSDMFESKYRCQVLDATSPINVKLKNPKATVKTTKTTTKVTTTTTSSSGSGAGGSSATTNSSTMTADQHHSSL